MEQENVWLLPVVDPYGAYIGMVSKTSIFNNLEKISPFFQYTLSVIVKLSDNTLFIIYFLPVVILVPGGVIPLQ